MLVLVVSHSATMGSCHRTGFNDLSLAGVFDFGVDFVGIFVKASVPPPLSLCVFASYPPNRLTPLKRDAAAKAYEEMSAAGIPEYNILIKVSETTSASTMKT